MIALKSMSEVGRKKACMVKCVQVENSSILFAVKSMLKKSM